MGSPIGHGQPMPPRAQSLADSQKPTPKIQVGLYVANPRGHSPDLKIHNPDMFDKQFRKDSDELLRQALQRMPPVVNPQEQTPLLQSRFTPVVANLNGKSPQGHATQVQGPNFKITFNGQNGSSGIVIKKNS